MNLKSSIDKKTQDLLLEKVSKIKADYAEIRSEEATSTRIVYKGKDAELIAEPQSAGFFIRVLINGSWGITTFTDLNELDKKTLEAVNFAKLQGKGNIKLTKTSSSKAEITPEIKKDFREVTLRQKVNLVKNYNNLLLKSAKGIQSTNMVYADNFLIKFFVNSTGAKIFQQRPYIRISYMAIGRSGEVIEMYRGSKGHVGGFEVVEGLDNEMIKVSKEAVLLSKVNKVKGGKYTVILDPFMAGTFAHEAFGHFSEADHQYENPKLLAQMEIGKKIGSDFINIVDDPNIKGGWGNFVYDDEGVLAKKVDLLTKGVIKGRLYSLETAAILGEQSNGRARADGFPSKPIPRMSNTLIVGGKDNLQDLIKTTKNGILVVNWLGGMTAMEQFTFTAMYGVLIKNGKLTEKVRGVKLTGNVFETLKNIDGVTNDFEHDQGTCGKAGQGMPVGSGGAYVRIQNVTVGGQ